MLLINPNLLCLTQFKATGSTAAAFQSYTPVKSNIHPYYKPSQSLAVPPTLLLTLHPVPNNQLTLVRKAVSSSNSVALRAAATAQQRHSS